MVTELTVSDLHLLAIERHLGAIEDLLRGQRDPEEILRNGQRPAVGAITFTLPYPSDNLRMWRTTVDTTAKEVIWPDHRRIALTITNTGVSDIDLGRDEREAAGQQSYPLAGGASLGIDNYVGAVWARSASGTITLAVLELFR